MVEQELAATLGREGYARSAGGKGYRNGTRQRQLTGSFGDLQDAECDAIAAINGCITGV